MDAGPDFRHRIFVSSATTIGVFTLQEADALCQGVADVAQLGGTWTALVSTAAEAAISRITIVAPVDNLGGEQVAADAAGFWNSHEAGIDYDEDGDPLVTEVWTGTRRVGAVANSNCVDWSDSTARGMTGNSDATNSSWTEASGKDCDVARSLYCIDQ